MKKLIAASLVALCSLAIAQEKPLIITQVNPKGSNHDTISAVIADTADKSGQKYEHIVGKSCVNGVSAWNEAKDKQPVVLVYSSPSARLSVTSDLPCIPESETKTIKVRWAGQVPIYLCGTDKSKPFDAKGVKFSMAPGYVGFMKVIKASGYDWKFTPATSGNAILMLSNGDIDYGFVTAAFSEKLKGLPQIKCEFADVVDKDHRSINDALHLKYAAEPFIDATVVILSKNLTPKQEEVLAKSINKSNPAFVNGVEKHYTLIKLPAKGKDAEFLTTFINKNKAAGHLMNSIEN